MKRLLLIFAVGCAFTSIQAYPQDDVANRFQRHYLSISVGDNLFNAMMGGYINAEYSSGTIDNNWFEPDVYNHSYTTLPTFSLTYYCAFKPWLLVGAEAYYSGIYTQVYQRPQMERVGMSGTTVVSVLPSIRFQYFNRRYCGLYSGISLGLFMAFEHGNQLYTSRTEPVQVNLMPSFQLTAFGVRFGDKIYGTAEIGCGVKGIATIGIGTRF